MISKRCIMACFCRRSQRRTTTVRNLDQNNFIPSAVEVFNSATQTVDPNEEILFLQTNYNTGVSFSVRNDNLGVDIVAAGVYKITFTGVASTAIDGNISLALTLNGVPFPQSEVTQYVTSVGPQIVSTTMIFKVVSPNADIGVINTGDISFDITNAKLEIVRTGNF